MIKLALVGSGSIARTHAQAAQAVAGCEVVAIVNHRAASMAALAQDFGIARQHLTLEELTAAGGVDAVIVCTPNFLHAPQSIAAMQAGLDVLLEKPMAMNAAEAQRILQVSESSGAVLQIAHCLRFLPDVDALRQKIAAGLIGPIIRTRGSALHCNWGPSGWFTRRALAGGGALADMGIHAIDTVRCVLGDPQPHSVYAQIGTQYGDYDVEDSGTLTINWANGVSSLVEFGWWQPWRDGMVASTHFFARAGYARLLPTQIFQRAQPAGALQPLDIRAAALDDIEPLFAAMYQQQLAAFVESVRTRRRPLPGGLEGWVNMQIIDAAYESQRSGRLVVL